MNFLLIAFSGIYFLFVLAFIIGLYRLRPIDPILNKITVSVVVAARNEARYLPDLLDSLIRQDYPAEFLEITIVDDRSDDDTPMILDAYTQRWPQIQFVRIDQTVKNMTPKKYALTKGIEQSTGSVILATDADCQAPEGWVRSMVSALTSGKNPPGIVVGFSRMAVPNNTLVEYYQRVDFLAVMAANAGAIGMGWGWSGSGQNLAYRRETFDSIGGFASVAQRISGDDVYLVQAISKHSPVLFNAHPNSFMTTRPVATWRRFLSQHIRWSSNSKHLLKTDRIFLFFLISAFITNLSLFIGWFFIAIKLWLTLGGFKFILDYTVIILGARQFQTPVKFSTILIWFLLQPLYIPIAGLGGLVGRFTWK
ncbi:MAG: glycosyltransferase [FCB group bacterium]|nr:glycosyltransferase [FCB group bacterium]